MKKILKNLDEILAAVVLVVLVVIMFLNVVFRQVKGISFSAFADELTTKLFVLFSLLGASIAAKRGTHLGLTILTDSMNAKIKKWVLFFGFVVAMAFCVMLAVYGAEMTLNEYRMGQRTLTNQWPEWLFGLYIPIGAAFCALRFGQQAVKQLKGGKEGKT